jgi:putative FmdB family regulatory protein
MPTYLYYCEVHGEFETDHSIKDLLTTCPLCKEQNLDPKPVKRLISKSTNFVLTGSCWAKDNYR